MFTIKPLMLNHALDQDQTKAKSKFLKINQDFYINPAQIGIIAPGKNPGTTVLLAPDTTVMATVTDSTPEEVVKVFDVLA